jgi:ABC-type uncharacterized transport system permease subunit
MNKIFNTIIVLGLVVIGVGVYSYDRVPNQLGSVAQSGEYQATTTYSKLSVPTFNNVQTLISNGPGVLGSVVITGAVAGPMRFINATSSTDIASTTIATFPNSTAAGTYVFDVVVTRGLIVESLSGLMPTSTITFRQY